ncbi:MAG: kelch repeat-containing protein, partial [Ferruginibacter sp.]
LSQTREGIAVASAGNKILFGGGVDWSSGTGNSSRVDIYDLTTQTWSKAELSVARYDITAMAAGSKIFFAGGEAGDGTAPVNTVDIFDVSTNTWSASSLSVAGYSIAPAAVGNKVLFAGGEGGFTGGWPRGSRVDIYDLTTNAWSTHSWSEVKRGGHSAVTVNNKVYFAGGEGWPANPVMGTWYCSNRIDVYDNATNSWSTSSLSEGKLGHASIAVDNKIYWAGGYTGTSHPVTRSCTVEIRDVVTGASSIQYLSKPNDWLSAVTKDNKIIYYSSNSSTMFDIYDIATNTWAIGVLPVSMQGASIISVNNTIYLAGGKVNGVLSDKVWKLEF